MKRGVVGTKCWGIKDRIRWLVAEPFDRADLGRVAGRCLGGDAGREDPTEVDNGEQQNQQDGQNQCELGEGLPPWMCRFASSGSDDDRLSPPIV